jgi:hypothetical protein
MNSVLESEIPTILKLTEEKLELCLKVNNNPEKKERLLNECLILLNLLNEESKTNNINGKKSTKQNILVGSK